MTPGIAIRDARIQEVATLSALCFRSKAVWGYSSEFMDACRPALTLNARRLSRDRVRVAEARGVLAGVSVLTTDGEIDLLFVEPDFMRRGVGGALLDDMCAAGRNRGMSVLWILADPGAVDFYRARGAVQVSERPSDVIEGRSLPWLRLWIGDAVPELRSKRLRLRGWEERDRAPMAALHDDPKLVRYLPGPIDRASSDGYIDRAQAHFSRYGFGLWAVERVYSGTLIGAVGLAIPRFEAAFTPCVEIGWRFGSAHWGQGFATEAAHAVLDHAFSVVDLDEVVSFTTVENIASRRVMERIGMTRDVDGDFDHPSLPADSPLLRHALYRKRRA